MYIPNTFSLILNQHHTNRYLWCVGHLKKGFIQSAVIDNLNLLAYAVTHVLVLNN